MLPRLGTTSVAKAATVRCGREGVVVSVMEQFPQRRHGPVSKCITGGAAAKTSKVPVQISQIMAMDWLGDGLARY